MSDRISFRYRIAKELARRPAIAAAGVFMGGILLHAILPHRPFEFVCLAIVAALFLPLSRYAGRGWVRVVGAWRSIVRQTPNASNPHPASPGVPGEEKDSWPVNALISIAILCSGVAAAQIEAFYFPANEIGAYATDQPHLAKLELELDHPLRTMSTDLAAAGRPLPPRQITTARVMRVLTHAGWADASGEILVHFDPPNESLAMGQRIRVLGMLQRPAPALNPGEFDWAAYYRQQRILASIQVPHSDAVQILERHWPPPVQWLREAARRKLAAGFTPAHALDRALLSALVLGDTDPEATDIRDQFHRTGTSYLLAISGMHIAFVGLLVYAIARLLRIRPRWTVTLGMALVLLYGLIAMPTMTGVRALIVVVAVGSAMLLRRNIDRFQLFALAVWAMLIFHPLDLFSAGFQTGFVTVAGLLLLTPRLFTFLGGEPTADEQAVLAPGDHRPDWRVIARFHARQKFLRYFTPALVAWAMSMPLMAFYYDQINPWTILAGPILLPFMFVALAGGLLKLVLTALLPFGAGWWAAAARLPVAVLRHMVDALAHIPGSHVPLPAHSLLLLMMYYAMILLPLVPMRRPRLQWAARFGPIAAVLFFIALPLTGGAVTPGNGALRVTVLAVGAGQCAVVELPNGRIVTIDAGSSTLTEAVRKCIAPFFASRGAFGIDEIWLSHGDFDHISAAAELIRTYGVRRVVVSTEFEDRAGSVPDETLLETIHQRHVTLDHFHRGEHLSLGKDVSIDVLWPPENTALSSNNAGLVLKLTYARRTILFPADIQQIPEAALTGHPDELHCDVLIAPHHGSSETTTAAFVAAADPLYIVSSNDHTLSQKQRLFEREIGKRALFRTDRCGAVTIQIDRNGGLAVTPYLPQGEPTAVSTGAPDGAGLR